MNTRGQILIRNIVSCLPIHSIEVVVGPSAWFCCDNMAAWLATSDDFVDIYKTYIDQCGVNFEGVKTAASLGNLRILECAFSVNNRGNGYEDLVIATIVGAARTANIRTIFWLDIKSHFKALQKYTDTPRVVRDVALGTRNRVFVEKCLTPFKGCQSLMGGLRDFDVMILTRKISGAAISKFPIGGIYTDAHLRSCEMLTLNELSELFVNGATHYLIDKNMRFVRYFIDRCELNYPKLRIPWKKVKFLSPEFMIEILQGRPRLQADCLSCMFYNITYHRKGYPGDWVLNYDIVAKLLHAGFKWHCKLKHLVNRLRWRKSEIERAGIYEYLIRYEKNRYIDDE